jgi:enamine deaminase RidA (YjgF/YER057c/UK114 family)
VSIDRFKVGPRMSQAVVHGDTVYIAGQVADDAGSDAASQVRQILGKIDALLAEAGTDKSKLLSATVWLADIAAYSQVNAVWDAWVVAGMPPVRACVESKLAGSEYKVEIAAIAARS